MENQEQNHPTATLSWSLDIECPKCKKGIDLADHDDDSTFSKAIFNNSWDDLKGEEVQCPHCQHWFEFGKVEY